MNENGKPEIVEYIADDKGYRITSPAYVSTLQQILITWMHNNVQLFIYL